MPRKPSKTQKSTVGDPLGVLHKNVPTDMVGPLQDDVPQASASVPTPDAARQQMIADAAYYRAEQRGFGAGHELEDWLAAEAEIVAHSLVQGCSGTPFVTPRP
jgi:hypothetical protein